MKISLRDRIIAKVYGSRWMVKFLRQDISNSNNFIKQYDELLNDTRKLGHLPEGVKKGDIKNARYEKRYLQKVIRDDKRQLSKWKRLKDVI